MPNCVYGFEIYSVKVQTMRTIVRIFVAFSEKLNFTDLSMNQIAMNNLFVTKASQPSFSGNLFCFLDLMYQSVKHI